MLTSVRLIGLEGNITSKDVTRFFKMAVIRTFFNLDTGEIMEQQESDHITTTQVTHTRKFHFLLHIINSPNTTTPPSITTTSTATTITTSSCSSSTRV